MSPNESTRPRCAGLLLAAGRSRRMGGLKQTMPWPDEDGELKSTVIASAFHAIAPFCEAMFIVVGADASAIAAALGKRSFTMIEGDSDAEMIASVRSGLIAIANVSPSFDAVLMQPGDHPGVAPSTIDALLSAHLCDPSVAIMPEHQGKGGHPALIPIAIARAIIAWIDACGGEGGGGGLRQFWIDHPQLRLRLAVDDPRCMIDLDTPEDYQQALARFAGQ